MSYPPTCKYVWTQICQFAQCYFKYICGCWEGPNYSIKCDKKHPCTNDMCEENCPQWSDWTGCKNNKKIRTRHCACGRGDLIHLYSLWQWKGDCIEVRTCVEPTIPPPPPVVPTHKPLPPLIPTQKPIPPAKPTQKPIATLPPAKPTQPPALPTHRPVPPVYPTHRPIPPVIPDHTEQAMPSGSSAVVGTAVGVAFGVGIAIVLLVLLFIYLKKFRRGVKMNDELEKWEEAGDSGPWRVEVPDNYRSSTYGPTQQPSQNTLTSSPVNSYPSFLARTPPARPSSVSNQTVSPPHSVNSNATPSFLAHTPTPVPSSMSSHTISSLNSMTSRNSQQ